MEKRSKIIPQKERCVKMPTQTWSVGMFVLLLELLNSEKYVKIT